MSSKTPAKNSLVVDDQPRYEDMDPYRQSAEGEMISRDRVLLELKCHGYTSNCWEAFNQLCGDEGLDVGATAFNAGQILDWRGY